MNRVIVSLIVVLTLVIVSVDFSRPSITTVAAAPPTGEDLYIQDTSADTGIEPNPDTGPMWVTEDIWVTTSEDPGYQPYPFDPSSPPWTPIPHESPEYRDPKMALPNYVYVRVRNRGTAASSGTERLRLYWAKASTGLSWPTQWGGAGVDFLASNCGPTKLYGAEVTKPRKDAGRATVAERDAYRNAVLNVGQSAFVFPAWVSSYWHKQQEVHNQGPTNRHNSAAFLPWHREFVNRYEVLLQEFDPTVKLLYWDWTTDPENSTNGVNLFTSGFMGASGRGSGGSGVSIGAPFNATSGATLAPPSVTRNLSTSTTPLSNADSTLMSKPTYGPFAPSSNTLSWDLEKMPNHNSAHGYIGGGGNMSFTSVAAQDPFFFMLHANVDRLWAQWQRNVSTLSRLDPFTTYDNSNISPDINLTIMRPWDGTGPSIQPWTTAGGYKVSKLPLDDSVVSPPIYDCAPLVIPVLQPGEAVVIQIPWFPPNPADFACFGADQGHVCLLARIETGTAPQCEPFPAPFGMTSPEGTDINANTRNNNNIAWKNVTVVDFVGKIKRSSILVRNVFRERVLTTLRFTPAREGDVSFFENARIFLNIKPEVLKRWRERGAKGRGIKLQDSLTGGRLEVVSPGALIQNIPLEAGEVFPVDVQVELGRNYQRSRTRVAKFDLIQMGKPGNENAVIGGQRFELDLSKLTLVKPGSQWRFFIGGTDPHGNWKSRDFDDSKWRIGKAELGFGDDPLTNIEGGPATRRRVTTYFRHSFEVTDPGFFDNLILRLKRDDGAVVYLNGKEVHRTNMPTGVVRPATLATREVSGLEEEVFFPIQVDRQILTHGANVLAVEVHQNSRQSTDLSFDLELLANPVAKNFPPDVGFASLTNGTLWQVGETIPINVHALDTDGKITNVSLFANGKLIGSTARAPFTFQWRDAPIGTHRLRAVATDGDQQTEIAFITVNVVANLPPTVQLSQPREGAVFRVGEIVSAVAPANDRLGKIDRVEFFIRDADLFASEDRLVGTAKAPPFSIRIRNLAPGHYMLIAVAWDNAGMANTTSPVHFQVIGSHRD